MTEVGEAAAAAGDGALGAHIDFCHFCLSLSHHSTSFPLSLFTSLHEAHTRKRTHAHETHTRSKVWSNYTKLRHQKEETSISFPPQNSHQRHSRPASDDTTPQNSPHTAVNFSPTVDQTPNQQPNDEFVSNPRINHHSLNRSQWSLWVSHYSWVFVFVGPS